MESTLTRILGLLTVSDPLRQDAAATMARLQAMGLELCLLSGDRRAAVEHLAHRVGLGPQAVIADTRPQGKGQVIEDLRTQGRCVAMVAAPMAARPHCQRQLPAGCGGRAPPPRALPRSRPCRGMGSVPHRCLPGRIRRCAATASTCCSVTHQGGVPPGSSTGNGDTAADGERSALQHQRLALFRSP
ncbi:MAG: HAD family hydrolase, partial [Synechococcus sp. SB0670_bin_20]|nr:HAD family hydrolase [Synechococcus sp. SB0670_bin_20]